MKLAIATAVTQKCDLLLLDEPTNHLDVASVQWLADYLVTLKGTTCCIVSHDYAFLRKTCTDVMHIANLVRARSPPRRAAAAAGALLEAEGPPPLALPYAGPPLLFSHPPPPTPPSPLHASSYLPPSSPLHTSSSIPPIPLLSYFHSLLPPRPPLFAHQGARRSATARTPRRSGPGTRAR